MKKTIPYIILMTLTFSSCKLKNEIDGYINKINNLKLTFEEDSIFKKSPLNVLVDRIDYVYNYYLNIIDTVSDLSNSPIINDYSYRFLDIDSIINPSFDKILLVENSDSRELIKIKLLRNKLTLLKRVKTYYDKPEEIQNTKIIRLNPTIKKGSWKRIILFMPDSYNIIACSDTGYFYGFNKFVIMEEKADIVENDSICIKIFSDSIEFVHIIRFNIYE